jgi:hypothetical protein
MVLLDLSIGPNPRQGLNIPPHSDARTERQVNGSNLQPSNFYLPLVYH